MTIVGTVINQTSIDTGDNTLAFVVTIDSYARSSITFGGVNGTGFLDNWFQDFVPKEIVINNTPTCFVTGLVVSSGSLLTVQGAGGLPLSYNNILLAEGATIIDADIFV